MRQTGVPHAEARAGERAFDTTLGSAMALVRSRVGPIAIDFGTHALRVMQLSGGEKRLRVLNWASHVYPLDSPANGLQRSDIVEALRGVLKSRKFVGTQAVTALGEREMSIKSIRLPKMPEAELHDAVRLEAQERMKDLDDEAEIRFIPAGTLSGSDEKQQEILVLTVDASVIREHLDLLSDAGLESAGVDAMPCAIFRPFERYLKREADHDHVNMFVDIGRTGSRIVITRGTQIVFIRHVSVGGAAFDRVVATSLSLDLGDATNVRRGVASTRAHDTRPDQATIDAVTAATQPAWEKLGREIGLCARYFAVTFRSTKPDSVTCVGGESQNTQDLEYLSRITEMPCNMGAPLRNLEFPSGVPAIKHTEDGAAWATCVGLSMKPIASAPWKSCG